jgi:hypothetical protein
MTALSIRVYHFAHEMNVPTDVVLREGRRLGFDVRHGLSTLTPEEQAARREALRGLPPEEPPLGIPSKLLPRGPGPGAAYQQLPPAEDDPSAAPDGGM